MTVHMNIDSSFFFRNKCVFADDGNFWLAASVRAVNAGDIRTFQNSAKSFESESP